MSAPSISPIRKVWLRWKSLRLPWRKKFLVGLDLGGNTYWEFKDSLNSNRWRRIVQYPSDVHYSDVSSKITPAWHQWLRHTREDPPSLTEQAQDLVRQENLKVLAAQADARWAAKGSVLDAPQTTQVEGLAPPDPAMQNPEHEKHHLYSYGEVKSQEQRQKSPNDDPWKQTRGGPSAGWQPQGWDPNSNVTKR